MKQVTCPYCGNQAVFTDSSEVYGGRSYGMIYLCRPCKAYVGVHKGTDAPLGRLADSELRTWKIRAHAVFDPLWKSKQMTRGGAYRHLQSLLGLKKNECHIGKFDVKTCKRAVEALSK